jgi:hypothetical protein
VRAGGRATTATVRWKLFSIASKDARVVWLSRRACRVHSVQVLCMLWLKRVRTQRRPRSSVPYLSRFFFLVLLTSTRSPSATEETTLISSRLVWTKQVVLDLLHRSRSLLFVYNPNTRRPRKTSLGGSLANSIQFYSRVVPALAATLASN